MATATIIGSGDMTSGARKTGLTSASVAGVYLDPDQLRKPEYTVYLHTISRRTFMQPHGIYRQIAIPACPKDKRSHCFMQVQHPVQQPNLNPDDVNGPPLWKLDDARSVALGVCNPSYVGKDLAIQDKELNPESVLSSGECDLTRQGIFASMNAIPTEDELQKAEKRRETYYRFRLAEADKLARSDPKQLGMILTEDHHLAADYFAVETEWHRNPSAKVDCPNCGGKIPGGVAFHYDNGRVCVLDWERAWLAGAVKKDDVPEPKRWWNDEPSLDVLQAKAKGLGIEVDLRWSAKTLLARIQEAEKV